MHRRRRLAGLVLGTLGAVTLPMTVTSSAVAAVDAYHPTTPVGAGATGPVVLSDDGSLLAVAKGGAVELRRTSDEASLVTLPLDASGATVTSIDFASAASLVVGTDSDVEFLSWKTLSGVTSAGPAVVADGLPAAASVVAAGATRAYALDAATGDIWLTDVTGTDHSKWIGSALVLPDTYAAIAYGANRLYAITDTGAATVQEIAVGTTTGNVLKSLTLNRQATALAISPDGQRLFIGEAGQLAQMSTTSWAQPSTTTLPAPVNTAYPEPPTLWDPAGQWDDLATLAGSNNTQTVFCNALAVAVGGATVYCTDTTPGGDLFWFDAAGASLRFAGAHDIAVAGAPGLTQPVAATAGRVYAALATGAVTSIPVASVLAPEAVPDGSRPSAPLSVVVASRANTTIDVSWTAPAATGGQRILGYLVTAAPLGGGAPQYCRPGATGTACTLTGLTPHETYDVSVQAANVLGVGAVSDGQRVTPGIPTAVPNVALGTPVLSGKTINLPVSWSPTSSGDSRLRGYAVCADVVASPQSTCAQPGTSLTSTCTPNATVILCPSAAATSATLIGLDPTKTYRVTVTAYNQTSAGIVGTPLTIVPGAPSVPTALSATVQNQTVTLTWRAPTYTGVVATTGATGTVKTNGTVAYTAFLYTDTGMPIPCQGSLIAAMATTTCTWTGLTNGATYSAEVYGWSGASTSSTGGSTVISGLRGPAATLGGLLPSTRPGAPTGTAVSTAPGAITVTWEVPDDDGGSPITGYTASARASGRVRTCTTTTQLTCTITGLDNGVAYGVTVTATNARGVGLPTAGVVAKPAGPSSVVRTLTATASGTTATVEWDAPASLGAESIASYTLNAVSAHGARTCTTTDLMCRLSGLVAGDAYTVTVTATNSGGFESAATAPVGFTPLATPATPSASVQQLLKRHRSTHKANVTLRWTGVTGATGYVVNRTGGRLLPLSRPVTGAGRDTAFAKMPKGTYSFTIVALGPGSRSLASTVLTVKVK